MTTARDADQERTDRFEVSRVLADLPAEDDTTAEDLVPLELVRAPPRVWRVPAPMRSEVHTGTMDPAPPREWEPEQRTWLVVGAIALGLGLAVGGAAGAMIWIALLGQVP